VGLFASARKVGPDIKFVELYSHPKEVLQITNLATVFDIFERAEDAAASFKRTAAAN
jgi:anti-anti-sigma regulatory factor